MNNICKVMYGYKNSLHNKKLDLSQTIFKVFTTNGDMWRWNKS